MKAPRELPVSAQANACEVRVMPEPKSTDERPNGINRSSDARQDGMTTGNLIVVIPADAEVQADYAALDSRVRGNDRFLSKRDAARRCRA